jgi:hypothetical protein
MMIPTAKKLDTQERRLNRLNGRTFRILELMRARGVTLHFDQSGRPPRWWLSNGQQVDFIIAPTMVGRIEEARPCTLVCCIYRDGSPRLWPVKFPKDGEKDNSAWISARAAAKAAIEKWTSLVWVRSAYTTRDALEGFAPDPDWSKLPSFDELARLAFGTNGVIRSTDHDVYRELFGHPKKASDADDVL